MDARKLRRLMKLIDKEIEEIWLNAGQGFTYVELKEEALKRIKEALNEECD